MFINQLFFSCSVFHLLVVNLIITQSTHYILSLYSLPLSPHPSHNSSLLNHERLKSHFMIYLNFHTITLSLCLPIYQSLFPFSPFSFPLSPYSLPLPPLRPLSLLLPSHLDALPTFLSPAWLRFILLSFLSHSFAPLRLYITSASPIHVSRFPHALTSPNPSGKR